MRHWAHQCNIRNTLVEVGTEQYLTEIRTDEDTGTVKGCVKRLVHSLLLAFSFSCRRWQAAKLHEARRNRAECVSLSRKYLTYTQHYPTGYVRQVPPGPRLSIPCGDTRPLATSWPQAVYSLWRYMSTGCFAAQDCVFLVEIHVH